MKSIKVVIFTVFASISMISHAQPSDSGKNKFLDDAKKAIKQSKETLDARLKITTELLRDSIRNGKTLRGNDTCTFIPSVLPEGYGSLFNSQKSFQTSLMKAEGTTASK